MSVNSEQSSISIVIGLIRQVLGEPSKEILSCDSLIKDLLMDSIELIELFFLVEELGIKIPQSVIDVRLTVGDIAQHFEYVRY